MPSIEEIRQTIEVALERAKKASEQEKLRLAEQEMDAISEVVEAHAEELSDLAEQYRTLRRSNRSKIRTVIHLIKEQLANAIRYSLEDFDTEREEEALELLGQWRSLEGDTEEVTSFHTTLQEKIAEASEYRIAAVTSLSVNAKIEEAQRLQQTRRDVAPETILRLYNEAFEIALRASSANPTNRRIQALKDHAQRFREQTSELIAIATSGGQAGEYKKLLDFYSNHPDALVDFYKRGEEFVGKIPKEEAIERTKIEARAYAREKVQEYQQKAEHLLVEDKPEEALGELLRYRDNQLDTFLESNERDTIKKLEAEIQKAIQNLNSADQKVEAAIVAVNSSGVRAWELLVEADKIYAGIRHRPSFERAERDIVKQLRTELNQIIESLQSQYERKEFRGVIDTAVSTIKKYGDLDIPNLYDYLSHLEIIRDNAQQLLAIQTDISQELSRIKASLDKRQTIETQRANDLLNKLEQKYDRNLLEQFPEYLSLRSLTNSQLNADEELDRLSEFLQHQDPLAVERAMQSAYRSAELGDSQIDRRFEDLANQLSLHFSFLKAKRAFDQKQFDVAQEHLDVVLAAGETAIDYDEAANLDDEIRESLDYTHSTRNTLAAAEEDIANGRASQAFLTLRDSEVPPTRSERKKLRDLMAVARTQWKRELSQYFVQLSVENPGSSAEAIENALRALEIDLEYPHEADRYRRELRPVIEAAYAEAAAANARVTGDPREYDNALKHWQTALQAVGNQQTRSYIEGRINNINRDIVASRKEDLLAKASQVDESKEIPDMVAELSELVDELRNIARRTGDIMYEVWVLEVMLTQALMTESEQKRQKLLDESARFAQRSELSKPIRNDERLEAERSRYVQLARRGPEVGQTMSKIERQLGANKSLEEVYEAVTTWEKQLEALQQDFSMLKNWYAKNKLSVINDLAKQISDIDAGLDVHHLQPLAKLLILGDVRGNRLTTEISSLSARLDEQIENTIQTYRTGRGYEQVISPSGVIQEQIKNLQEQRKNINTINQILNSFRSSLEMSSVDDLLRGTTSRAEQLRVAIEELTALKRDYEAVEISLAEGLSGEEAAKESLLSMQQIFSDHPATKAAARKVEGNKQSLMTMRNRIKELAKAMQSENFVTAYQIAASIDGAELKRLHLDENLGIVDVYSNQIHDSWNSVLSLIQKRLHNLELMQDWAAPFAGNMSKQVLTCGNNNADGVNEEVGTWVVNWADIKEKVKQLVQAGNFEQAIGVVNQAMTGENISQMSLQRAVDRAENPVIVEETDDTRIGTSVISDVAGRYRFAIRYAGTRCAIAILREVQDQCLPLYRRQLDEARQLVINLEERQRRWENREKEYKAALRSIAAQLERKRANTALISQDIAQINAILDEMGKISGKNPLLEEMSNHYVLNLARNKYGVR